MLTSWDQLSESFPLFKLWFFTLVNENNKEFNKAIFNKKNKRILHSVQDDAIQIKCTNVNKSVCLEFLSRTEFEFSLLVIQISNTTAQFHCNHSFRKHLPLVYWATRDEKVTPLVLHYLNKWHRLIAEDQF